MKIDKVKIKNFRNYYGEHEFILDKTVTIIYGSNGFGKSSFFDAIEWCLTGEISRYDRSFERKSVINHNCNFMNDECRVEIVFGGNTLSRSFKVVNNEYKRENLKVLTHKGTTLQGKEKVDNYLKNSYSEGTIPDLFGSLIKQAHILSQDQVTDFISKDDPKDRFNALADIMGLKNVLYFHENFKGIKTEIESVIRKLTAKSEQITKSRDLRLKDKIAIDNETLLSIEKLIQKSPNINNFNEVLPSLEKKKLEQKQQVILAKKALNDVIKYGSHKIIDAKESLAKQSIDIKSNNRNIENLKTLIASVKHLYMNLEHNSHLIKEVADLESQIKEMKKILSDGGFSEAKILDITVLIDSKRKRLAILEYAHETKEQYDLLVESVQKSIEIPVLERKINRINKNLSLLRDAKEKNLLLINDSAEGIITLLKSITEIQNYIESHDVEGKCPVCSSHHGDKLQIEVSHNVQKVKGFVEKNKTLSLEITEKNSKIEAFINKIEKKKENILNEISKLSSQIKNSRQQLDIIKSNTFFDPNLFGRTEKDQIKNEINSVIKEIGSLNNTITLINDITKLEAKHSIKTEELGTKFVNTLSETDIIIRVNRLKRAEVRINNYVRKKQEKLNFLQDRYDNLFLILSHIPKENVYEKVPIEDIIKSYDDNELVIESELILISKANEIKHQLHINEKVMSDVMEFEKELDEIEQQRSHGRNILNSTNLFVNQIGTHLGTQAKDFLNRSDSLIQKYYRYLNPLPSNNNVMFEGDNGELNILIPFQDDKQFSNVKHTLSSGQLHVLAIAIFLAINESQQLSQLDFVAIDDPIQNMDDVNRFAICDVLGSIKKQLILSTHDWDFIKLFIKKNEHIKSEIQLYILESPQLKIGKIKRIDFASV